MKLEKYLEKVSGLVLVWSKGYLKIPKKSPIHNLYKSMMYSVEAGGKGVRSALVFLGYDLFKPTQLDENHPAIPFGAAVEMVHTYSLIHDDLPAMDDDDIRRGKPSNHIVYGEATAILAGDALLTKAFEVCLDSNLHKELPLDLRAKAAFELSKGVGVDGMVGGQYVDIAVQGSSTGMIDQANILDNLEVNEVINYINTNKTAIFMAKSLVMGAILAGASDSDLKKLEKFGVSAGVAYQMADDLLDVSSTTQELGKPVGSDGDLDKFTYLRHHGEEATRAEAERLINEDALCSLKGYEGVAADILNELATYIIDRRK